MNTRGGNAVCFVNFYTAELLNYQLGYYASLSGVRDFQIFIVDNSRNSEAVILRQYAKNHNLADRVTIIDNSSTNSIGSDAHAEGLDLIIGSEVRYEYYIFQDPDFFWLIDDVFKLVDYCDSNGIYSIGSPYRRKVGFGFPDYPCAWGCIYAKQAIEGLSFRVLEKTSILGNSLISFQMPEYESSGDVGWEIRNSAIDHGEYCSFGQRPALLLRDTFGDHSFESSPVEYIFKGKLVGLHLFRGSFPVGIEALVNDASNSPNIDWAKTKIRYIKFVEKYLRLRFFSIKYAINRFLYSIANPVDSKKFFAYFFLVQNLVFNNFIERLNIYFIRCSIAFRRFMLIRKILKIVSADVFDNLKFNYEKNKKLFISAFNRMYSANIDDDVYASLRSSLNQCLALDYNNFLEIFTPKVTSLLKPEAFILATFKHIDTLHIFLDFFNFSPTKEQINYVCSQLEAIRSIAPEDRINFINNCINKDSVVLNTFRDFYQIDFGSSFSHSNGNWLFVDYERLLASRDLLNLYSKDDVQQVINFNRFFLDFFQGRHRA